MKIMQGDSYPIPVEITQDGIAITPELVEEVEITIGTAVRKTYTGGGIAYEEGMWYFRLTQEESFTLSGSDEVVVRVKYPQTNNVVGAKVGYLRTIDIDQKEVI